MNGRDLDGWLHLEPDAVADTASLEAWLGRGLAYVASLPPK